VTKNITLMILLKSSLFITREGSHIQHEENNM